MEDKIQRFIELSKEFTVSSDKVYENFYPAGNIISISSNNTVSFYGSASSQSESIKYPTKLEQFTAAQEEKVAKAKRYEEYLELQSSLSNYYKAAEKLKDKVIIAKQD